MTDEAKRSAELASVLRHEINALEAHLRAKRAALAAVVAKAKGAGK